MELLALAVISLSLYILDTADSEATGSDCTKVITSQDKLTARLNDRVTFKCDVMSTIAPTDIHWLHVGRGMRMGSPTETVSLGPAEWHRLISVVHVTSDLDTGPYVCRVNGVCGWSRSDNHYIVLIDKPRVRLTPPVTLSRDPDTDVSYLVVTCVVDSYPSPAHVRWRTGSVLKGLPVYLDPSRSGNNFNTTVSADNATYTLTISLLNPHELGLYFCEASNIMGTGVSQSVLVILTNGSPKIVSNTTEVTVALDETVFLPCPRSPEGSETLWTRDGKNVTQKTTTFHADIIIEDTGLLIRHMRADLSGLYLCTRLWQNGTAQSASIRLSLTDGFSKPTIYPLAWKHDTVTTTTTDGVTTTTATRIVPTNLRLHCAIAVFRQLETVYFRFLVKSNRFRSTVYTLTPLTQRQNGPFYEYEVTADLDMSWQGVEETDDAISTFPQLDRRDEVVCQVFSGNTKVSEQSWAIVYDGLPRMSTLKGPSRVDLSQPSPRLAWSCQSVGASHSSPVIDIRLDPAIRQSEDHTTDPPILGGPQTETRRWSPAAGAVLVDVQRTLNFGPANRSHTFHLLCHVNHRHTTLTLTFMVHIDYPPRLRTSPQQVSVKRGSPVILDCGVGDTATLTHFYWAKVNGTIDLTSGNFDGASQDSPMLTIYHSEAINAGLYYCVAGNVVKEVSSPFIQLIVFEDEEQGLVKAFFGDTVTLRCRDSEGRSPATPRQYEWSCDSNQNWTLSPPRFRVQGRYLTISAVQLSDAAMYRCTQTDDLGAIRSLLFVLYVIPESLRPPTLRSYGSFRQGSQSKITCSIELSSLVSVKAFPVRWSQLRSEETPGFLSMSDWVHKESDFVIYTTELTFSDLSAAHSGILLTCIARLGEASSVAEHRLEIRGKDGTIVGEDQRPLCLGAVTQAYQGLENYNIIFATVVSFIALSLAGTLIYCQYSRDRRRREDQYYRLSVLTAASNQLMAAHNQRTEAHNQPTNVCNSTHCIDDSDSRRGRQRVASEPRVDGRECIADGGSQVNVACSDTESQEV